MSSPQALQGKNPLNLFALVEILVSEPTENTADNQFHILNLFIR